MQIIGGRGVHCNFGGRETKNQPTFADVNVWQFQYVSEKDPILNWIGAVNNYMCPVNH